MWVPWNPDFESIEWKARIFEGEWSVPVFDFLLFISNDLNESCYIALKLVMQTYPVHYLVGPN